MSQFATGWIAQHLTLWISLLSSFPHNTKHTSSWRNMAERMEHPTRPSRWGAEHRQEHHGVRRCRYVAGNRHGRTLLQRGRQCNARLREPQVEWQCTGKFVHILVHTAGVSATTSGANLVGTIEQRTTTGACT